jgi:hypothetical protein
MKKTWSIVVVYEDAVTREHAVKACDHLVERFWSEREFEVHWCSCAMLGEAAPAREASDKAVEADLIIFSLRREREISSSVTEWIEDWLSKRGDREGALLDLTGQEVEDEGAAAERHIYLRHAAHRGGMDYLTREPDTISWSMPDSLESVSARAAHITSVLDEILRKQTAPASPSLLFPNQ